MLSVVPMKQSNVSQGYYLQQDGGYYIEDKSNRQLYEWYGKGADTLGLSGEVKLDDYKAVFSGNLPNGETIGRKMPNGTVKGRPGYDLTFSLNKDLSLIICCSDNKKLSDYFLKAHISAVKTVMSEVEKRIQARTTTSGVTSYETTKNMVSALCTHFSSRAGDPDVHTHALVANATERSDGKWRALATDMSRKHGFYEVMRDHAVYFGAIYQNEMAIAARRQSFSIEPVYKHNMFKIKDFPNEIRDHFSKRQKQIELIVSGLDENAKNNRDLYREVAKNSRAAKEPIDQVKFFEKSKTAMMNFLSNEREHRSFDQIIDDCSVEKQDEFASTKNSEIAFKSIVDAISHQSLFSVSMQASTVINKAISFDLGSASHHDYHLAFEKTIQSGLLLKTNDGNYTTQAAIKKEQDLISATTATFSNNHIKTATTAKHPSALTSQLKPAFKSSRLCIIEEPKHLQDKQALLSTLVDSLEKDKKTVKILAINKSLSNQHNDYARKNDVSIWQRLKRLGRAELADSLFGYLNQYEKELAMPLNNLLAKNGREVFIVDDAQRINLDAMQRILTLTEKRQAKVIFLKHSEGIQNTLAGNPLSVLEKTGVNQINAKQTFPKSIDKSKVNISIEAVPSQQNKKPQDRLSRQAMVAKTLVSQYKGAMDNTLVLSHSKNSAEKLNGLIRDELIACNRVSTDHQKITVSEPVYLSDQEQKHTQFYASGIYIKTYLGKGQFRIQKVHNHDLRENKLILQNEKGRFKTMLPSKISTSIKNNEATLHREKTIELALGDSIRLKKSSRQADLLKLKIDEHYKVNEINEKTMTLEVLGSDTHLKIKTKHLQGLPIAYDYVRSINEPIFNKNKHQIVCDLPSYAVNANLISELSRHTEKIHIITENKSHTEKRMGVLQVKQNASDHFKINIKQPISISKENSAHKPTSKVIQKNQHDDLEREFLG